MRTAPAQIRLLKIANNPWYEVTLIEGRNRQIRRMFEQVGHLVEKIKRVRFGSLKLDVETGKCRELTPREITQLQRGQPEASPKRLNVSKKMRRPEKQRSFKKGPEKKRSIKKR